MEREILYFAALRERVGTARERVQSDAATPRALLAELAARSPAHEAAFSDPKALRCALDQQLAELDAPLGTAREIAFFPPMTGG